MKRIQRVIWRYVLNWILLIDMAGNTLIAGDPRETISSRMGKIISKQNGAKTFPYYLCRFLSLFDHRHCEDAINKSVGERDLVFKNLNDELDLPTDIPENLQK